MGGPGSGGRNRLPTTVKAKRGTLQRCRSNPSEPNGTPGLPDPPPGLDSVERRAWKEEAERLSGMGTLRKEHVDALLLLVKSKVRYLRLCAKVAELGEVLSGEDGRLYRNPYAVGLEKAQAEYRRACESFGLTAASAALVSADRPGGADPASKRARFFPHLSREGGAG